ncbi:hypothetical protein ES702_04556 [subsurface metagenome]
MIDYLIKALPILAALIVYFVRLEVKLAVITRDLCWIKKRLQNLR